jgi:hypothetical protein
MQNNLHQNKHNSVHIYMQNKPIKVKTGISSNTCCVNTLNFSACIRLTLTASLQLSLRRKLHIFCTYFALYNMLEDIGNEEHFIKMHVFL